MLISTLDVNFPLAARVQRRCAALLLPCLLVCTVGSALAANEHPSIKRPFDLPPSADLSYSIKASQRGIALSGDAVINWRSSEHAYSIVAETRTPLFGKILDNKSAGAVAIKGNKVYDFTARMHVERAFGPTDDDFRFHRVPIAAGGVTYKGVRDSILEWWRVADPDYAELEGPQIVRKLATEQNEPVFVLLDCMPDAKVRDKLRDEFPRMLFVAPAPDVDPPDAALVELELEFDQNLDDYLALEKRERDGWARLRPKQKT